MCRMYRERPVSAAGIVSLFFRILFTGAPPAAEIFAPNGGGGYTPAREQESSLAEAEGDG